MPKRRSGVTAGIALEQLVEDISFRWCRKGGGIFGSFCRRELLDGLFGHFNEMGEILSLRWLIERVEIGSIGSDMWVPADEFEVGRESVPRDVVVLMHCGAILIPSL